MFKNNISITIILRMQHLKQIFSYRSSCIFIFNQIIVIFKNISVITTLIY